MKRILVITDSVPFPPSDGKQLPVAEIFRRIAQNSKVDFLILSEDAISSGQIAAFSQNGIENVYSIRRTKKKAKWNFIQEKLALAGYHTYDTDQITKLFKDSTYDLAWVSPITCMDFLSTCQNLGINLSATVGLGVNDVKTYLYRDSINEILQTHLFSFRYFLQWLKSFFLYSKEKKILDSVDFVLIQSEKEKEKIYKIISSKKKYPKVIVAPNGIKSDLFYSTYKGLNSNKILYMTHLEGGRKNESKWFIKKVWTKIKKQCPEAILYLVGKPPSNKISYIEKDSSIKVMGYVENLPELFDQVRLTVVPTFHGTGLINRILDALTAGVPTISTLPAIKTFPNIQIGKHLEMANSPKKFAEKVVMIYRDENKRLLLSKNGRRYAKNWPTWENNVNKINNIIFNNGA